MNEQEHQYRQTLWRSQCAAITHHTRTQAHTHKKGEGALHPCCFCLCTDRRRRRNLVIFPFSRFSVFAVFLLLFSAESVYKAKQSRGTLTRKVQRWATNAVCCINSKLSLSLAIIIPSPFFFYFINSSFTNLPHYLTLSLKSLKSLSLYSVSHFEPFTLLHPYSSF